MPPHIFTGRPGTPGGSSKGQQRMGSAASGDAIRHINEWSANPKTGPANPKKATDDFGSLTFSEEAQRARLPKEVYRALRRSIAQSEPLDPSLADIVATALK